MPNYLKNSCKVQVSGWKSNTVITLIWITLKQMQHLKIKFCKSRSFNLKNSQKEFTVQQESQKKTSWPCLNSLANSLDLNSKTWQTYYPEDYMKAKTTRTYSPFFSKENSKCFFILTWSTLLDLAAVPDEFSLLPVFLNKQIPPAYQYLKKTLKIWVGKQW